MSEVGDNRDNRGHFSDALSSKPATPNLKMEYKFENQNQSNLKSALSKPTTPSNFLSHSNMKLFKKIVLVQESTTSPSSTVTSKADSAPNDGMIKISKVLSVSYKLW